MKKYKFFSFISTLLIISLFFSSFPSQAKAVDLPDIEAKSALLVNADTGEVYYEKNSDSILPPASITKIMTALLAIEAIDRGEIALTDMVTASSTSHNDLTLDGSSQNIVPGETMSVEGLLYCMLVSSANEACNIIGEYITGGSISDFIELMNSRARALGCVNTHFVNAHGLPAEDHYSTASDIALIAAAAIKHSLFVDIVNTVYKELPATNKSDSRYLMSTNYLINPDRSQYYYREARGIKTGSTEAAGHCLVSYVVNDSVTAISIVLGCEAKVLENGKSEVQSFIQTKKLMEWFLSNYSTNTIISTTELICEVPVELAEGTDCVVARPQKDISMLLPSDVDPASLEKSYVIFSQLEGADPLIAPVASGDIIGEISFKYNGKDYGPVPLVANTSVDRSNLAYLKYSFHSVLNQTWVKLIIAGFILILILYFAFVIRYNTIRRKRRKAAHEAARRGTANSNPFTSDKK